MLYPKLYYSANEFAWPNSDILIIELLVHLDFGLVRFNGSSHSRTVIWLLAKHFETKHFEIAFYEWHRASHARQIISIPFVLVCPKQPEWKRKKQKRDGLVWEGNQRIWINYSSYAIFNFYATFRLTESHCQCTFRWRAATVNYETNEGRRQKAKMVPISVSVHKSNTQPMWNLIVCELSSRSQRIACRFLFNLM